MSAAVALEPLDLAALLCSRVCHDLISPVGAIVNGLEVLEEEKDSESQDLAMTLIRKSAHTASAKLQFCRIAFGAAGSAGAQIDTGDAETISRGFLEDGRTKVAWNVPRAFLPKNRVKLLLNMLLIANQSIPRGGELTVDATGEGELCGFRVTAQGSHAKIPHGMSEALTAEPVEAVDAHRIQPLYTALLARDCKVAVAMETDGERVIVSAG